MTLFISVDAATASISANKTSATVGDTVTISVSMNAAAWNTKLTGAVPKNFAGCFFLINIIGLQDHCRNTAFFHTQSKDEMVAIDNYNYDKMIDKKNL